MKTRVCLLGIVLVALGAGVLGGGCNRGDDETGEEAAATIEAQPDGATRKRVASRLDDLRESLKTVLELSSVQADSVARETLNEMQEELRRLKMILTVTCESNLDCDPGHRCIGGNCRSLSGPP